ncbi:hypothetical protein [Streptomyces erythrochromogenes]
MFDCLVTSTTRPDFGACTTFPYPIAMDTCWGADTLPREKSRSPG